jgi:hypothetical protein
MTSLVGTPARHSSLAPPNRAPRVAVRMVTATARLWKKPTLWAFWARFGGLHHGADAEEEALHTGATVGPADPQRRSRLDRLLACRAAVRASSSRQAFGVPRSMARTLVLPDGSTASIGGLSPKVWGRRLITSRTVPSPPSMTSRSRPSRANVSNSALQSLASERLDQTHASRRRPRRACLVAMALRIANDPDTHHVDSQDWMEPFGAARPAGSGRRARRSTRRSRPPPG